MVTRISLITVALAATALAACSPRQDFRGYAFDEPTLEKIKPGAQTQAQVAQLLGSPSSISTFTEANNTWYYIYKETETTAFLAPEVVDQKVVAIDFDDKGKVKDLRRYTLKDGKPVEPISRETPTRGRELGFFEQIFGNIGRFGSPKNTGTSPIPGGMP